ncbi:MAG: PEP-CTERM sorting domain-containing protein, partial [Planctomycetales bacterium]|nr:PEP-CTERM sorting domain-containing protein [Planctomycetales bacterium]
DPTTGVAASSEIATCCSDRDPADIVNGSGLVGGLHDVNPSNMWLSIGSGFGGVDPNPFVIFDMGDVHTINSFNVWNYNEAGAFSTRGVNAVTVEYGNTPALGSTVSGITNFAQATGAAGYAGENFNSFTPFDARFVKFDIDTNHGDASTFYGLSEVQFDGPMAGPQRILGVTATATSELAGGFSRFAANIVDNVGLDTNVPDGAPGSVAGSWLSTGNGSAGGGADLAPEIVFDLGSIQNVGEMHVYNYNENAGNPALFTMRGVDELEILVSNDNFITDIRSLGLFNFTQATGLANLAPDIFDLGGVEAQYVKFDIASSHGGDNNFVGLNEVLFFQGTAQIPEPTSIALWALVGLGLVVFARRRARR